MGAVTKIVDCGSDKNAALGHIFEVHTCLGLECLIAIGTEVSVKTFKVYEECIFSAIEIEPDLANTFVRVAIIAIEGRQLADKDWSVMLKLLRSESRFDVKMLHEMVCFHRCGE